MYTHMYVRSIDIHNNINNLRYFYNIVEWLMEYKKEMNPFPHTLYCIIIFAGKMCMCNESQKGCTYTHTGKG